MSDPVRSETVYRGRKIHVSRDEVKLPDGGTTVRDVVRHPGAVAVVGVRPDGRILLLRHWRHAIGREIVEIPAGTLEAGEDPADCARRELEEETGWVAGRLEPLASFHTAPGFCDERLHLFLATDLVEGAMALEPGERLEPWAATPDEVRTMIAEGRLEDAKTLVGLLLALGAEGRVDG